MDAKTGLPDTTAWAFLYPAGMPDSTIMKEKPLYAQKHSMENLILPIYPQEILRYMR